MNKFNKEGKKHGSWEKYYSNGNLNLKRYFL